jgi:hypothetical protein
MARHVDPKSSDSSGRRRTVVAVASPSRTRPVNISTMKPCASMIASVHPSGEPASSLSARSRSAPGKRSPDPVERRR